MAGFKFTHAAAGACAVVFAVFCTRLYKNRMRLRRIQRDHDVRMIPHSFVFGHLLALIRAMRKYGVPYDLDRIYTNCIIVEAYPEVAATGVIYLDIWPLAPPVIAVTNAEMATQLTIAPNLPKHRHFRENHIGSLTSGIDVLSCDGDLWKSLRGIYNVGFSMKNVVSMTPWFVEEAKVFRNRLLRAADSAETIELETFGLDLALDIISRASFGTRSRLQDGQAPAWATAFRKVMSLMSFELNIRKAWYPPSIYSKWKNNAIMREEFTRLIYSAAADVKNRSDGPRTMASLAVKEYVDRNEPIPPETMESIIQNIKIFLLAGHETTAVTLARLLYFLNRYPDKLALVRAEHDAVFGPDPERAANVILEDHTVLNKLTYTLAAIKETLRLFPPTGGSVREASSPDSMIVDPDSGKTYPTHGFVLNPSAVTLACDEKYWIKPLEFIPERFLVRDENDPLYPVKNVFQPFSLGPRICIGQEMAHWEIRLVVSLVVRDLDFFPQYPANAQTFRGHAAYAANSSETSAVARTKSGLPVKVVRRDTSPNAA